MVLFLVAILLLTSITPAFAAQKISNPGNFDKVDGIDSDPKIGLHNSYAWCSQLFEQTDADYLWVGMNRDMGQTLLGQSDNPLASILGKFSGLPDRAADSAGKIYRQKAADDDASFELVYENPAINGYRKMILYKGYLYVCAGLTNKPAYNYSIILRFAPDFKKGDTPEIVMWDYLPEDEVDVGLEGVNGAAPEYFRSACVYDGKLYVGTFDSKIYVTDGENLENLTPTQGAKATGWALLADLEQDATFEPSSGGSYAGKTYIWDMLPFNGGIYVFATNAGFTVYKLTPKAGGYDIVQTVGSNASAKYPRGMGIAGNVMASPFHSVSFDKDYVYVSTFASGPLLLGNMAMGNADAAFNDIFCPAQIYRFDTNDKWEVVVGDTAGKFVAKDKADKAVPMVGNQRAGFFTGNQNAENVSFNQYIWWMAEHNGKLYASTWDLGVFKKEQVTLILTTIASAMGSGLSPLMPYLQAVMNAFGFLTAGMSTMQSDLAAQGIGKAMNGIYESGITSTQGIQSALTTALAPSAFVLPDISKIISSLVSLFQALITQSGTVIKGIMEALPLLLSLTKYTESSNPGGFDLFVSEDGKNFAPVTVDGFGYDENYGGRVLLPTKYGLFACTANPFAGGQIWRVDDIKPEIMPNIPAKLSLQAGQTASFSVRTIAMPEGTNLQVSGADVSLQKRGGARTLLDTKSSITFVDGNYSEAHENVGYQAQMYDLRITAGEPGTQNISLTFTQNGVTVSKTIALTVTAAPLARMTQAQTRQAPVSQTRETTAAQQTEQAVQSSQALQVTMEQKAAANNANPAVAAVQAPESNPLQAYLVAGLALMLLFLVLLLVLRRVKRVDGSAA